MKRLHVFLLFCSVFSIAGCSNTAPPTATTTTTTTSSGIANLQPFSDPSGTVATYTTAGFIDTTSPFFQSLGTNGRTCISCHQPSQGMTINAATTLALFNSSKGTDALFAAIDGANYPTAPTGDAASHSLLLNNGLIRVAVTLPATTEFTMAASHDP